MSHIKIKTEYQDEGLYNKIEKKWLYADHNLSNDIVSFYDEKGKLLFAINDSISNNMIDALNRLFNPLGHFDTLNTGLYYMSEEEKSLCKL